MPWSASRPKHEAFRPWVFASGSPFRRGSTPGDDLELAALLTRSFDAFRLHGNLRWTRLGDTLAPEKADRFEGIVGLDVVPGWTRTTDTLLVFDVAARSNSVRDGETVLELGAGRASGSA